MDTIGIILTYQRPKVLSQCLNTLLNNTGVRYKELYLLDDCSDPDIQQALFNTAKDLSKNYCPTHLFLAGENRGIGYAFETAYSIMRSLEEDCVVGFVESDYIFRKGYLEDVLAVFEATEYTLSVAGVDHPDMVMRAKTHGTFVDLMVEQFGRDLKSREWLYQEFDLNTSRGPIRCRPVSNSCGSQWINWGRLKKMFKEMKAVKAEKEYWKWMERAFHKNGTGDRRYASDAHMSGTLSMMAEDWIVSKVGGDIKNNFGMLSISDFSIAEHLCALGINGMLPGLKEGDTFVYSPTWDNKYLTIDPRS